MSPDPPHEIDKDDPAFEVHPSVLFRLGEELIQDEIQAIAELAKNCYDANSRYAKIEIDRTVSGPGGQGVLRVSDAGEGMTEDTLRTAFLTLADSPKRKLKQEGRVPKGKRLPLGDKGLGRLGAQRLGAVLTVRTRPATKDGNARVEHEMSIDWSRVAKAQRLSEVRFPIVTRKLPTGSSPGTDLEISGLRSPDTYSPDKRRALQSHLVRLVSPFGPTRGFRVTLAVDGEAVDLYSLTKQVLDAAVLRYDIEYTEGTLHVTGHYGASFFRNGTTPEERRAKQSLSSDGGRAFVDYLNASAKRHPQFDFQPNERWFASRSFKADLADLSPAVEVEAWPTEGIEPHHRGEAETDGGSSNRQDGDGVVPVADPGPFKSQIYMVFVQGMSGGDRDSELRDYVRDAGGVRIYREGFAINIAGDWLGLRQGATSSASSYGLRSGNVLGYVDLSVSGNPGLVEATDREAFVATPHLSNFLRLFEQFSDWADQTQAILRRQFKVFGTSLLSEEDEQAPTADSALRSLARHGRAQKKATEALRLAKDRASSASFGSDPGLSETLDDLATHLDDLATSEASVALLRQELAALREQLVLTHEAVAVGLSAETLAHEVALIADRLAREAKTLRGRGTWSPDEARHLTDIVEAGARSLSKQASYLSPTLRYRREDRASLQVGTVCEEVARYHCDRMSDRGIGVRADIRTDFTVKMNRGRLTQVLDNLVLNSEYWILDERRRKRGKAEMAEVVLTVERPRISVSDTGPGISPELEGSLFEPFTTTKPRGVGRGLGLFIARQLLEYSGGTIELGISTNAAKRKNSFELDLSGAIK